MPPTTKAGLDKVSMQSADNDLAPPQTKTDNHDLSCVWDYKQRGWEARVFLRQSLSDGLTNDKRVSSAVPLSYPIHGSRSCCRRDSGLAVMRRSKHFIKFSVAMQSSHQRIREQVGVGAVILLDCGL